MFMNEQFNDAYCCVATGGSCQDDPRGQPGGRGDVPPGHRASPGERRGLLEPFPRTAHATDSAIIIYNMVDYCQGSGSSM